jgi:hypothetical protein
LRYGAPLAGEKGYLTHFADRSTQLDCPGLYFAAPHAPDVLLTPHNDSPDKVGRITLTGNTKQLSTDAAQNTPKTKAGIGVGAAIGTLLSAYPKIERTGTYSGYVDYYGITNGSGRWIVFEVLTDAGIVVTIDVGTEPTGPPEYCG